MSQLLLVIGLGGVLVAVTVLTLWGGRCVREDAKASGENIDYALSYAFFCWAAFCLVILAGIVLIALERI